MSIMDATANSPATPAAENPAVTVSTPDGERLTGLAEASAHRNPEVAARLLAEIDRARWVAPAELPQDVVAMNSYVEYYDDGIAAKRSVQLVYPNEADIALGKISVLTLVGTALLGLKAGQSIMWPKQDGRKRRLEVLRVSPRPFPDK